MITARDIQMMSDTVEEIIKSWNTKVTIKIPLPEAEQINFNPIMREYNGEVYYNIFIDVPAERKDLMNMYSVDVNNNKAGQKLDGTLVYSVPLMFNMRSLAIDEKCIFKIDDSTDEYQVSEVGNRIGETLVHLRKLAGGTVSGIQP